MSVTINNDASGTYIWNGSWIEKVLYRYREIIKENKNWPSPPVAKLSRNLTCVKTLPQIKDIVEPWTKN